MNNSFNFNPGLCRIVILAVCIMLLMIFSTARAEDPCKLSEVRVWQVAADGIAVQARSDDGRPVKFELFSETGSLVRTQQIIHSKITTISGLKKALYSYRCVSNEGDERSGKITVK